MVDAGSGVNRLHVNPSPGWPHPNPSPGGEGLHWTKDYVLQSGLLKKSLFRPPAPQGGHEKL